MQEFRDRPIYQKLIWINMLASGTALVAACFAFIGYDLIMFRDSTARALDVQARIIGSNNITPVLFDDPASSEATLEPLRSAPNIVAAGVYSASGQALATYSRDGRELQAPLLADLSGETRVRQLGYKTISLERAIITDGKQIGVVYIVADFTGIGDRLRRYAGIAAVILAISMLAALLISRLFQKGVASPIMELAKITKIVSGNKDYSIRASPPKTHDEIAVLIEGFNEMLEQIQERDAALQKGREELEDRVERRTHELSVANTELEAFSYSVSHDLRAPLRSIDGFCQVLLEDYADKLDANGQNCLQRVRGASQRMSVLIDDMLNLARISRAEMRREPLSLTAIASNVANELKSHQPERDVDFVIEEGLSAEGDARLLRVAIENLLGNSWKYTSNHARARIEFGRDNANGRPVYYVRDDGAGFDPEYSERLFGVFQRLHKASEFPGTGVGLATVQRIIRRHGGNIWAKGAVEKGATFYFTL